MTIFPNSSFHCIFIEVYRPTHPNVAVFGGKFCGLVCIYLSFNKLYSVKSSVLCSLVFLWISFFHNFSLETYLVSVVVFNRGLFVLPLFGGPVPSPQHLSKLIIADPRCCFFALILPAGWKYFFFFFKCFLASGWSFRYYLLFLKLHFGPKVESCCPVSQQPLIGLRHRYLKQAFFKSLYYAEMYVSFVIFSKLSLLWKDLV